MITEMSGRGVATVDPLSPPEMTSDQHQRYDARIDAVTTQARTFARDGIPAARVVATAITTAKPRTRYTVGRDGAVIVRVEEASRRASGTHPPGHRSTTAPPTPAAP